MISVVQDAERIAGEGKYEDIVAKLRESGLLYPCISHMRSKYEARLNSEHFAMTDGDWELLTVLGLYDESTLEHSIRTFELAYILITHPFAESPDHTVLLGDFLGTADVSREQFLRAALFHDIGKVIIPREVLRNTLDDEEVLTKMFPSVSFAGTTQERRDVLQALYSNGVRPIDIVPVKDVFTGEAYANLLCKLEKRGFPKMATLKDIIWMHEPESKRILTAAGYPIEGELAGHHHNYEKKDHHHIIRMPGMSFGAADLIRIADVTDALRSGRWYKRPLSELDVLFVLTTDAEVGKIHPRLAYLWVNDRYAALQEKGGLAFSNGNEKQEEVRAIETFLNTTASLDRVGAF